MSARAVRQPDRAPPDGMLIDTHRILHKQNDTPGGRAARNAKYLLGSPSTLEQAIHLPDHCAILCPDRYRSVLGLDDKQINYRPVCYRALLLEGRKEPVTGLRRHPLIYPIFGPLPNPLL